MAKKRPQTKRLIAELRERRTTLIAGLTRMAGIVGLLHARGETMGELEGTPLLASLEKVLSGELTPEKLADLLVAGAVKGLDDPDMRRALRIFDGPGGN